MKLTKLLAAGLRPPLDGTSDHRRGYAVRWDSELIGFGVLTTNTGCKSYFVRARVNGRERRHTLGRTTVLSADLARRLAQAWLGRIAKGEDPVAEQRHDRLATLTLREAARAYCESGRIKASTVGMVNSRFARLLPDWLDLPLTAINEAMIEARYSELAARHPADATIAFRYFRACWNHARNRFDHAGQPVLPECPTARLKRCQLWAKDTRRERSILPHQMPTFVAAVDSLTDPIARGFFRFLWMTGCRRSEAAALLWPDVDLDAESVIFRSGAGIKSRSYAIPLPSQLVALLSELPTRPFGGQVFGDAIGRPRGDKVPFHPEVQRIRRSYGAFGPHDLRRTFVTAGELAGVKELSLKRLVNHSTRGNVTAGYFAATVEQLRPPMQKIADTLDVQAIGGANVLPMRRPA